MGVRDKSRRQLRKQRQERRKGMVTDEMREYGQAFIDAWVTHGGDFARYAGPPIPNPGRHAHPHKTQVDRLLHFFKGIKRRRANNLAARRQKAHAR